MWRTMESALAASPTLNPALVFLHRLTPHALRDPTPSRPLCDDLLCWDLLPAEDQPDPSHVPYIFNLTTNGSSRGSDGAGERYHWEVLFLLFMVLAGVMGNVLVCMAISVERKLHNVTNFFLMSLAIADLFVSVLVMPGSIVYEIMGYWPFGLILCDMWQVSDVMMCTSSIMHMCTISLDRYIGIRNPLKMRNKSRRVVIIKVAIVWLISFLIASPLILLAVFRPGDILTETQQCGIFNKYFTMYGSIAAFFFPLLIMLVAYSLTIHILHKQAQQLGAKTQFGMRRSTVRRNRPTHVLSYTAQSKPGTTNSHRHHNERDVTGDGTGAAPNHRDVDASHSVSGSMNYRERNGIHRLVPEQSRALVANGTETIPNRNTATQNDRRCANRYEIEPLRTDSSDGETTIWKPTKRRKVNKRDRCTKGLGGLAALTQLQTVSNIAVAVTKTARRPAGDKSNQDEEKHRFKSLITKHRATIKVASLLLAKRDDNDKKHLHNVKTERKAVKVLGTMFAIFVICWAPFFSINLAMGVCSSCDIELLLFKIFLWLGYLSSTLNPIIYTIFNRNFKTTFARILKCGYCRPTFHMDCHKKCNQSCFSKLFSCGTTRLQKNDSNSEPNYDFYKYSEAVLDEMDETKV